LFQLLRLVIYDRSKCKQILATLLPSFLATKAFRLTVASLSTCDLANVSYYGEDGTATDIPVTTIRSFGLFRYSESSQNRSNLANDANIVSVVKNETAFELIVDNVISEIISCHKLDRHFYILDNNFRIARAAGGIALFLGLFTVIVTWLQTCKPISKSLWNFAFIGVLLCTLMEGLTLLIFHALFCSGELNTGIQFVTDGATFGAEAVDCKIARGAGATIAACAFWFTTAISIFLFVPLEEPSRTSLTPVFSHPDDEEDNVSLEVDLESEDNTDELFYSDEILPRTRRQSHQTC